MSNWLKDEALLQTFRSEVSERIASLQSGLLRLETSPDDVEVINAIFRDAHTVKGSAKMMGFTAIKELAHRMEDVLGDVKEGRLALGPQLADVLLQSSDAILRLLDSLDDPESLPEDVAALIAALEEARVRGGAAPASASRIQTKQAGGAEHMSERDQEVAYPGSASVPAQARKSASDRSDRPTAPSAPGTAEAPLAAPSDSERQDSSERPTPVTEGVRAPGGTGEGPARPANTVEDASLKGLGAARTTARRGTTGGLRSRPEAAIPGDIPTGPAETVADADRRPEAPPSPPTAARVEPELGREGPPRTEAFVNPIGQSIRIEASKVYELIDQAGEAVIGEVRLEEIARKLNELQRDLEARTRRIRHKPALDGHFEVLEDARQRLATISAQLTETVISQSRALDRLQEQAMGLAMLPTATIFAPFPRLVRNLSRQLGKEVDLVLDGGGTELDKQVLEQIVDPIRHLLINAIDHGIERPEERERAGKPRRGSVKVVARHRGRQVVIEVSDDGKGIDPEKVRAVAMRKGLVDAADEMSTQEILSLLFRPGFSTASLITDTSGRGVGLDVVKEAVDRLKGTVEVASAPGRGTTFTITLPITLAIVDVLLVMAGGQDFAIPVAAVEEVLSHEEQAVAEVAGRPCIQWRGQSIALFDTAEVLGVETAPHEGPILVISSAARRVALRVEALVGQQEVVIKGLGSFLPRVRHIVGCSILGDGRVVLVLDPNELVDTARRPARAVRPASSSRRRLLEGRQERAKRRLLVVDDSLAIREMLRSIFEAAGYDVALASDGEAALQVLQATKVDGVVTDIEMPRMDGFELTRLIRERPDTQEMPVVIVTGLAKEEDKRRGLEVGANAYIVKSAFDQTALLDAVKSLVG